MDRIYFNPRIYLLQLLFNIYLFISSRHSMGVILTSVSSLDNEALVLFSFISFLGPILLSYLHWFVHVMRTLTFVRSHFYLRFFPFPSFFPYLSAFCCETITLVLLQSCRSNSLSFSSLGCKMRWFLQSTWKCCMQKQLHTIDNALLWNFLLACIWIHGLLVETIIGEEFNNLWNSMHLEKYVTSLTLETMVIYLKLSSHW